MKLHQLDWKAKPEMKTVVETFSETEEEAANDKTERGAFSMTRQKEEHFQLQKTDGP